MGRVGENAHKGHATPAWGPLRAMFEPMLLMLLQALHFRSVGASLTVFRGYTLLGEGPCDGDNLFRLPSAMKASLTPGNITSVASACADLCDTALSLNRCMGFQAQTNGFCLLFDVDWSPFDQGPAEGLLKITLDASLLQNDFPGLFLERVQTDRLVLTNLGYQASCYRRRLNCTSAPNCTALNRFSCDKGKLPNVCGGCLPRYQASDGSSLPGNEPCSPQPNASRPTLRIAFGNAAQVLDDHTGLAGTNRESINTVFLSMAFSLKVAWETRSAMIPIPLAERANFDLDFFCFTQNDTLATTRSAGGFEWVSPTSAMPGLRAIAGESGDDFGRRLQLKELPSGVRPHAVLGLYSKTGLQAALPSEALLVKMGTEYRTPVLGWSMPSTDLAHAPLASYYVRTNRVVLDSGGAIGKLLSIIGYTRVMLVVQPAESRLEGQLRQAMPGATISVERPAAEGRGPCAGQRLCTQEILLMWRRVRAQDARVIVHESGGENFERFLLIQNDLLGEKTVFIQAGLPCGKVDLFEAMLGAQRAFQALDALNITQCQLCVNPSWQSLYEEDMINMAAVAKYVFGPDNAGAADFPGTCPQFPDEAALAACSYCDGHQSYFASPTCSDWLRRFDAQMANSFCVSGDQSATSEAINNWFDYFSCLREDTKDCSANSTDTGLLMASRLQAAGMPQSYFEDMLPGGRLWQAGLDSSAAEPITVRHFWVVNEVLEPMGYTTWQNNYDILLEFVDAILATIVAFNEFVREGGDADAASTATRVPSDMNLGSRVAEGWLRFILGANFDGMSSRIGYLSNGERSFPYPISQVAPAASSGCYVRLSSSSSVLNGLQIQYKTAEWNHQVLPEVFNLTVEVIVPPRSNIRNCDPLPSGYATGKVMLVRRGACFFTQKALVAQRAGAVALISVDPYSDIGDISGDLDPLVTIPSYGVGWHDGDRMFAELYNGSRVTMTIPSSRCVDRTFHGNGVIWFGLSLRYDPVDASVRQISGVPLACVGTPGQTGSRCDGLAFSSGSSTPPRQEAEQCSDGSEFDPRVRECVPCEEGFYSSRALTKGQCVPCPGGYFAAQRGNVRCGRCLRGSFSKEGSSSCSLCPAGSYSDSDTAPLCEACREGRYAPVNGTDFACTPCGQGTFSNNRGMSFCQGCPPGLTTSEKGADSIGDCTCSKDTFFYRREPGGAGTCVPCPDWLSCPGGLGPPLQGVGYRVGPPAFAGALPSSAVRCKTTLKCPGETPLDTCPNNREGRGCDLCARQHFEGPDGACAPCEQEASSALPFTAFVLGALVVACGLYVRNSNEASTEDVSRISVALGFSVLVGTIQSVAAFGALKTRWTGVMSNLQGFFSVMTFRFDSLRPGCVLGSNDPQLRYFGMLLLFPIFGLIVFAVFGLNVLRRKVTWEQVWNTQGTAYSILYLSVSVAVLNPWRCISNPDDTWSMDLERSVRCWDSPDHQAMLGVSVPAVLFYIVGWLTLVSWVTIVYPRRVVLRSGVAFLKRFKFLLQRFQPERYYFVVPYTIRLIGIAFLPVFLSDVRQMQLLVLMVLFILAGFGTCFYWPWRTFAVNCIDAACCGLLLLVLGAGCLLIESDYEETQKIARAFLNSVLGIVYSFVLLILAQNALAAIKPRKRFGVFLSAHTGFGPVIARWFQVMLAEKTNEHIFVHADHVEDLHRIADLVAFKSHNLVVVLSRQSLGNIWCACELASAIRHGVKVTVVALDDYIPPSDTFIAGVSTLWNASELTHLAAAGLALVHVEQAYQVLREIPVIWMSRQVNEVDRNQLINSVLSQCRNCSTSSERELLLSAQADIFVIADREDLGAACNAQVFQVLLQKQARAPVAIFGEAKAREGTVHVIVLLSRGVLARPKFAAALVAAHVDKSAVIMPVVADSKFTYPDQFFWAELSEGRLFSLEDPSLQQARMDQIQAAYRHLLETDALTFSEFGSRSTQLAEIGAVVAGLSNEGCLGKKGSLSRILAASGCKDRCYGLDEPSEFVTC